MSLEADRVFLARALRLGAKGLYTTHPNPRVGCVLVRDSQKHRAAYSYHPPYYHFGEEATNFFDYGPQNSRGFRALKVWLSLRSVGRVAYLRMLQDDIALAQRLYDAAAAHAALEPVTRELSITTFRYRPADLYPLNEPVEAYLNDLNEELLSRLQNGGEAYVSNAVLKGRMLLRACIVNFRTEAADIDALVETVVRLGREVDAEQRPAALR